MAGKEPTTCETDDSEANIENCGFTKPRVSRLARESGAKIRV